MKIRNILAACLIAALFLGAASPAFAASGLTLSMEEYVTKGVTTQVKMSVTGGNPNRFEFRLYCGSTLVSSASACGNVKTLSIPGKLLTKNCEYTLRVKYINANGSYGIEEKRFTVQSDGNPTKKPTETKKPTATSKPTAKPTESPGGSSSSSLANEVVRQVNEERIKAGLSELTVDRDLTAAACVRGAEIVKSFSHTRPDGTSWTTVSGKAKGENIAKGQQTADRVMAAWMSSQGHRANILRTSYKTIGVCAYEYNGIMYWVQLFGN